MALLLRLRLIDAREVNPFKLIKSAPDVCISMMSALGIDINAATREGNTALHGAVSVGNIGIVRRLLRMGASPHVRDQGGNTPLHLAAAKLDRGVCRLLIDAGADVYATNKRGLTPLRSMGRGCDPSLARLLRNGGCDLELGWL
jgi:ankyrin repeat protein